MNHLNPLFAGICNDHMAIARGVESQDARYLERLYDEADAQEEAELALAPLTQPHEEALAAIYGCLPSDIWEACARLRADKVTRED